MIVTSVSGHLMETDVEEHFRKWSSCDPFKLFDVPVQKTVKKEMTNIDSTLRKLARFARHLVLWLDCDREGENICFEVIERCRVGNPSLNSIHRAKFSSLIPVSDPISSFLLINTKHSLFECGQWLMVDD